MKSNFIKNKYTNWYFNIIESAKRRKVTSKKSMEHHHILPKCLYPDIADLNKNPDNGVYLTYREHFICHLLLTKMSYSPKLLFASWRMANTVNNIKINSYVYNQLREKFSKNIAIQQSNRKGTYKIPAEGRKNMSLAKKGISWDVMYGEERTTSRKENMKIYLKQYQFKKGLIPWNKGNTQWNDEEKKVIGNRLSKANKGIPKKRKICEHCNKNVTVNTYPRYHGDKCKLKPILN